MRGRPKLQAVCDPVDHARRLTGCAPSLLSSRSPWEGYVTCHTTGEFCRLDRGFHQHCGPVALTNMVCTLRRARGKPPLAAPEIFRQIARLGQRRLTYWNIHERFHTGGTSYFLLPGYVGACLRRFGIRDARVRGRLLATPEQMAGELERGRLLCLSLFRHGYYGSHVVLACGTARVAAAGRERLYLQVADGWSPGLRYIAADTLGLCGYVAVEA